MLARLEMLVHARTQNAGVLQSALFFSQSTAHPLAPNPTASLVEGPHVVGRRFPVARLGVVGRIRLAAMPRIGVRNLVPHTNRHELERRVPVPILLKARPRRAPGPRRLCRLDSRDLRGEGRGVST